MNARLVIAEWSGQNEKEELFGTRRPCSDSYLSEAAGAGLYYFM